MIDFLSRIAGPAVATRISYRPNAAIIAIVNVWPDDFQVDYACGLGFEANTNFNEMAAEHLDAVKD